MEKTIRIEKTAPRDVLILEDGKRRYQIANRNVMADDRLLWLLVHRGADLFSGFWELDEPETRRTIAGFYYIPSSYRYGEDLQIRHHPTDGEFLFRRLAHDEDRWVLTSREGDILLETLAPEAETPGVWTMKVKAFLEERVLWPLVCLLAFDRLACGRL